MGLITSHQVLLVENHSLILYISFVFTLLLSLLLSCHSQAFPLLFVILFRDLIYKSEQPLFKHISQMSVWADMLRLISMNQLLVAQAQ